MGKIIFTSDDMVLLEKKEFETEKFFSKLQKNILKNKWRLNVEKNDSSIVEFNEFTLSIGKKNYKIDLEESIRKEEYENRLLILEKLSNTPKGKGIFKKTIKDYFSNGEAINLIYLISFAVCPGGIIAWHLTRNLKFLIAMPFLPKAVTLIIASWVFLSIPFATVSILNGYVKAKKKVQEAIKELIKELEKVKLMSIETKAIEEKTNNFNIEMLNDFSKVNNLSKMKVAIPKETKEEISKSVNEYNNVWLDNSIYDNTLADDHSVKKL